MREQHIKIHGIEGSRKVLIIDETPDDWRIWKALHRFLGRKNDLGVRVYITLLEKGGNMFARDLATRLGAPLSSVQRVLSDLLDLDLVTREPVRRGNWRLYHWRVKRSIIGIVRLLPKEYFSTRVS